MFVTLQFFNEGIKDWAEKNGLDEFTPGSFDAYKQPLIAQPGEDWNYGVNIDWAGQVLEKITGKTLGQWSKENIFDPLGCKDIQYSRVSFSDGHIATEDTEELARMLADVPYCICSSPRNARTDSSPCINDTQMVASSSEVSMLTWRKNIHD